jgi:hypothetical protein
MNRAEEDNKLLEAACESLGEHFDTIQIFVTRHEPTEEGGTISATWGSGNYFAGYGQAVEWVVKQDERSRQIVREQDHD